MVTPSIFQSESLVKVSLKSLSNERFLIKKERIKTRDRTKHTKGVSVVPGGIL